MIVGGRQGLSICAALTAVMLLGVAAAARVDLRLFPRNDLDGRTRSTIADVKRALLFYQTDNADPCPPSLEVLYTEHYVAGGPRDAWHHPLRFVCPGVHVTTGADVSSSGPDGVFGTADDLRSWAP